MNFFGLTDIGRTRKQNQDSIFICDDFENVKYFIIADGMTTELLDVYGTDGNGYYGTGYKIDVYLPDEK